MRLFWHFSALLVLHLGQQAEPAPCTENYLPCSCDDDGIYGADIVCVDVPTSEINAIFLRTSRSNLTSLDIAFSVSDSGVTIPADFLAGKIFKGYLALRCPTSYHLLKIDDDAFGLNSFQTVQIIGCNFDEQRDLSFIANFMQLRQFWLQKSSNIKSFTGIPSQANLNEIHIEGSSGFESLDDSKVNLPGLRNLWLNGNTFTDISMERTLNALAASSMDSLHLLNLSGNRLTIIPPSVKLFTRLGYLFVSDNQIQIVTNGTLRFPSSSDVTVFADVNAIERIEPGAFELGIKDMKLTSNRLTKFESEVFKPLLEGFAEDSGTVEVGGNSFVCDCHLEWLIKDNRHLLVHVIGATCSNSTSFSDLNPNGYEGCSFDE